ncbi:SRPBCC family protein [Kribbella sp. NPDC026611]|uniref:SRPBCC family protein n=1 Tax=Kribbella sp. NPDC026611 TaxID=3154911 RepID=UPI00340ECDA7
MAEPFVSSIEIDRAAADVFAYATDPEHFPEWHKDVVRVKIDGRAAGAWFVTVRRIAGSERRMTQEITKNRPPRSWAARGIDGPAPAAVSIERLDDSPCRATFSWTSTLAACPHH